MFKKNFFDIDPFHIDGKYRANSFLKSIQQLTLHHYNKCKLYKKILKTLKFKNDNRKIKLEEIPMIPTRLFKNYDLFSVPKYKIIKTLVSAGTSNSKVSKIYLDAENASNQTRALKKLMQSMLGKDRLPMIIIDKNPKNQVRKT